MGMRFSLQTNDRQLGGVSILRMSRNATPLTTWEERSIGDFLFICATLCVCIYIGAKNARFRTKTSASSLLLWLRRAAGGRVGSHNAHGRRQHHKIARAHLLLRELLRQRVCNKKRWMVFTSRRKAEVMCKIGKIEDVQKLDTIDSMGRTQ